MSHRIELQLKSGLGVEVEFEYYDAIRGYRNSLGVPEEPDDPGGVEIVSVTDMYTGDEVVTTDKENSEIIEMIENRYE